MELKDLKVDQINNLDEYKNIFGSLPFYEENNLHITESTLHVYDDAEVCNRRAIFNYLKLVKILLNSYDYFDLEIRVQVGIIDTMISELLVLYKEYKAEVDSYTPSSSNNWAQRFDEDEDYRFASNRLDNIISIKLQLELLLVELQDKLNNNMKRK